LDSPETGSPNLRYRDLGRRQRPHARYLNRGNARIFAGYSSETRKRRFASDCVVGPGEVFGVNVFNMLEWQTYARGLFDPQWFSGAVANRWIEIGVGLARNKLGPQ
jgi:hypothetical protein